MNVHDIVLIILAVAIVGSVVAMTFLSESRRTVVAFVALLILFPMLIIYQCGVTSPTSIMVIAGIIVLLSVYFALEFIDKKRARDEQRMREEALRRIEEGESSVDEYGNVIVSWEELDSHSRVVFAYGKVAG